MFIKKQDAWLLYKAIMSANDIIGKNSETWNYYFSRTKAFLDKYEKERLENNKRIWEIIKAKRAYDPDYGRGYKAKHRPETIAKYQRIREELERKNSTLDKTKIK